MSSSNRHQRRKAEKSWEKTEPPKERPSRASEWKEKHRSHKSQTCARIYKTAEETSRKLKHSSDDIHTLAKQPSEINST